MNAIRNLGPEGVIRYVAARLPPGHVVVNPQPEGWHSVTWTGGDVSMTVTCSPVGVLRGVLYTRNVEAALAALDAANEAEPAE